MKSEQIERVVAALEKFADAHVRMADAQSAAASSLSPIAVKKLRELASQLRSTDRPDVRWDVAAELDKMTGVCAPKREVGFGG